MLPAQRVFIDALGAWSSLGGPMARLEGGVKLTPNIGLFGYGQMTRGETTAGGGVRFTW